MFKIISFIGILSATVCNIANAGEQIRAAGSSTVYPFITVVAEEFGRSTDFKTPIVESIGTGGGFMLFCLGESDETTDIVNASRKIKNSEKEFCNKNGVKNITELKIGYDGIVIVNSANAKKLSLTKEQLFLAIAKQVPFEGGLVENNNTKWSDINPSFPNNKIEIYGPPSTSGTRDSLFELVMQQACNGFSEFKKAYPENYVRKSKCNALRTDGAFIEAGENDNLIVQKLKSNEDAFGIFGFSFLDQNMQYVQGAAIDSINPTFENILSHTYPLSRPLFLYIKDSHVGKTPGLKEFVSQVVSDESIGEEGSLIEKGLIPLGRDELDSNKKIISSKF